MRSQRRPAAGLPQCVRQSPTMSILGFVKGFLGEFQGKLAGKYFLDNDVYHSVDNVTLPSKNGTTQIDHVIVSRYGVFVVEAKNYSGWIFGNERDAQWTQTLFGKKSRFQNPLRQNYRHIASLVEFLGLPEDRFHSVVMFWGECEIKTKLPPNVLTKGYSAYIESKTALLFSDEEVSMIVGAIETGRLPATWKTHRQHVASLHERHGSNICPKCGSSLVERVAKTGGKAGKSFLGCSSFPKCRYTR
jgi:restriction system protein